MIETLIEYYRCPKRLLGAQSLVYDAVSEAPGFFEFGPGNICYGKSGSGVSLEPTVAAGFDALRHARLENGTIVLPFDFAEVIENLRRERYHLGHYGGFERFAASEAVRKLYYAIRGSLPFPIRRQLQRVYFRDWKTLPFPAWPLDVTVDNLHRQFIRLLLKTTGADRLPFIWFWPDGAPCSLIMTHDVETKAGRDFTSKLMDLDDSYGIKASYQVIPEERYSVPAEYIAGIRSRGCEFNIHDLNHDGNLYQERSKFESRAAGINGYAKRYQSRGFRAGAMYRRQDWYQVFEFSYDMSVPNVAHLEPLRGGCCTVMPYFVGKIVELPLTTTQDYSLFHILNDYSTTLWKTQLALIRENNGLLSLLTHPDYLIGARERRVYEMLLDELRQMIAREKIWAALPGDVDRWWRARNEMKLVPQGDDWEIVGPESERARVAYARLDGERLVYELPSSAHQPGAAAPSVRA